VVAVVAVVVVVVVVVVGMVGMWGSLEKMLRSIVRAKREFLVSR
jgi:hypothetical protein